MHLLPIKEISSEVNNNRYSDYFANILTQTLNLISRLNPKLHLHQRKQQKAVFALVLIEGALHPIQSIQY